MIEVADYTRLREGYLVPWEGRVDRCPRCGRNGIEEHPSLGGPYFLHIGISELMPDGMRDEALDCCPLPVPH
jgi:hypothetical protein